jgi:hypothetical protein
MLEDSTGLMESAVRDYQSLIGGITFRFMGEQAEANRKALTQEEPTNDN